MSRRMSFLAIIASVMSAGAVGAADQSSYQPSGGLKVTVLYGHPKNPEDFEKYYFGTHMPLVVSANPGKRMETSRCPPAADGSRFATACVAPPRFALAQIGRQTLDP